jgi:hypothetical protein
MVVGHRHLSVNTIRASMTKLQSFAEGFGLKVIRIKLVEFEGSVPIRAVSQ